MIKPDGNKWLCDIQPGGRGFKRYRNKFNTRKEAKNFERDVLNRFEKDNSYQVPKKDTRLLSDLVNIWYQNTGLFLSSGMGTKKRLLSLVSAMGSPSALNFKPSDFIKYRTKRIEKGISAATLNRELKTLKTVFNDLIHSDDWLKDNPLTNVKLIKYHQPKMQFLTNEQINLLMRILKESGCDVYLVALICLSTGARWGEAQSLTVSDLSMYMVHYHNTKSKKSRSVPISDKLYHQLFERLSKGNFNDSYSTFSRYLSSLNFDLPRGQRTHVLRHSFASHFMMNGGNILTLQKVLGHSSLNITMKYAHLSPDYLKEVIEKNPALSFC